MNELLNHLWQTTAFVLIIAAAARLLRGNRPRVRYWLWFVASLKFLMPFSLLLVAGGAAGGRVEKPAIIAAVSPVVIEQVNTTFMPAAESASAPYWTAALLIVWAVGASYVLGRWFAGWVQVRRALRSATPALLDSPIPVVTTQAAIEPRGFRCVSPGIASAGWNRGEAEP